MGHWHDVAADLRQPARELRDAIPDTWSAATRLHGAAMADGALPARMKEVIALTLAVVKRCDGCIAFHARAAARAGATPEEVAEALGVAIVLDGGPAQTYGPRAWQAFQEFRAGTGTGDAPRTDGGT